MVKDNERKSLHEKCSLHSQTSAPLDKCISSVTLCKRIKRTESRHARWAMYGVRDSTDCYLANCSDLYRKQYGIDTVKTRGNDLQSALAVPDAVYNPVS